MARALKVRGLMNVQYAIQGGEIYVLEVNPRASRTVPFVAKAIGLPVAAIAARVMAGETLASFKLKKPNPSTSRVKEAVLPFARFPGVDTVLGPEMRSTGEVMGLDANFGRAFAKSQIGAGVRSCRISGTVFISVKDADKDLIVGPARELVAMGFALIATRGTAKVLEAAGLQVATHQQGAGRPPACGGCAQERRNPARLQHDRRRPGAGGLLLHPPGGADPESALLHHHGGRRRPQPRPSPRCSAGSLEVAPLQSYSL